MIAKTPLLGFGAMRFPTLGKDSLVDIPAVCKMTDHYLDSGFNYFDTAYGYHGGRSEDAIKQAVVSRHSRDKFLLADKLPMWNVKTEADPPKLFAEQLKRCGVEYFDFYLMHGMSKERLPQSQKLKVYEYLRSLKAAGKIRHLGFSFHDNAEALDLILNTYPEIEFVQLQLNYYDILLGHAGEIHQIAMKHNVPVIVMEPVRGGSLANLPEAAEALFKAKDAQASIASWALRYAMSLPGVVTTLSGMSTIEQVEDNCKTAANFRPIDDEETKLIIDVLAELGKESAVPCTGCNYCINSCPKEIEIPKAFSMFNEAKRTGNDWNCKLMYNNIPEGKRAKDCISCGSCVQMCPQGINIPEELKKITF